MESLLKTHYETQKLNGEITNKTGMPYFINRADNLVCQWADTSDPEKAAELIATISDWIIHNGYDLETLLNDNLNVQLNRVFDANIKK